MLTYACRSTRYLFTSTLSWILTCDLLGDGVLHLQPGIHLHEVMTT
jgi:hypothetical protein